MKLFCILTFITITFLQTCAVSEGATIRENLQSFAKRIFGNSFSLGNPEDVDISTTTVTEIANTVTSTYQHVYNASTTTETPSGSLNADDIMLLTRYCPELHDLPNIMDYRYNEELGKCQRLQWRGTCGNNMIFYLKHSIYGECGCKPSTRIHVPDTTSKECYAIFSQGFCPEGQWVDITSRVTPICVNNPCANITSGKNLVFLHGQCVEVGSNGKFCPANTVVGFEWSKRRPTCIPNIGRAIGVPSVKCPPGTVRAYNMKCVTPIDLDDFDY
ncbi:unnamed protein product [Orchesella dallaii]|uniref:DUF4789 domain-containing protein n=1 Tax=Orchesella dallaii TaxID=48710 RepID=A0ABP1PYV5_9HEXA